MKNKNPLSKKTIIERQLQLIIHLQCLSGFIQHYDKLRGRIKIRGKSHLDHVNQIYKNQFIISIYKLFGDSNNYSFTSLRFEERKEIEDLKKKGYFFQLREAKRIYQGQRIGVIRNKHVAHLDFNRESEGLDWEQANQLVELATSLHQKLAKVFLAKSIYWEDFTNPLLESIRVEVKYQLFLDFYFNAKKSNQTQIPLSDLEKIIRNDVFG